MGLDAAYLRDDAERCLRLARLTSNGVTARNPRDIRYGPAGARGRIGRSAAGRFPLPLIEVGRLEPTAIPCLHQETGRVSCDGGCLDDEGFDGRRCAGGILGRLGICGKCRVEPGCEPR